jgi:hypothetical protein
LGIAEGEDFQYNRPIELQILNHFRLPYGISSAPLLAIPCWWLTILFACSIN